jgi:tetratricopeptide (TPR) repeat protein
LTLRPFIAAAALTLAAGCGRSGGEAGRPAATLTHGARVGIDPVPAVHLFENHSASLIVWRRAGVRDRILVHLDGHADLDWLPDATIARLAAADPDELQALELHPYAIDGKTLQRFGIWDFIYPAARLGLVREYVWVVPDGTLSDPQAAEELVRRMILGKMQMIALDEVRTLHFDGRTIRGTILGLPITICELGDLPAFDEPVLLDVDLDFLTTRSATSQEVTARPWLAPGSLVLRLSSRGIRADIATISFSTMGGFLPPACRWLGPALVAALRRAPEAEGDRWTRRVEADAASEAGRESAAVAAWRGLSVEYPEDGSLWYALSRAEARSGRSSAAAAARTKAVAADPVLVDAPLFEADALWLNQRYPEALVLYEDYRRARPSGPFLAYTLRREAGCLMREGHADEAIATLRKVIAMAPDHADTRLDLGVLLRDRGDLDGAIAQFLEARNILPDWAAYAMALGTTYARQNRIDEAVPALEAAVSRRPTWVQAQVNLGLLLAQAGRPVDAATHLNAAAMLEPHDPQIAQLLARLRRQGIMTTEVAAHP